MNRTLYATWIDYMSAYRLCFKDHQEQTVAYTEKLEEAIEYATTNGYELILKEV